MGSEGTELQDARANQPLCELHSKMIFEQVRLAVGVQVSQRAGLPNGERSALQDGKSRPWYMVE